MTDWKPFDTKKTLDRRKKQHDEATTSAGVGGYVGPAFKVPVPLKRQVPEPIQKKRKKKDR